jgi:hypothetical protein
MSTEKAGAHGGRRPGAGRKPKGEQRDDIAEFNRARCRKEQALAGLRETELGERAGRLYDRAEVLRVIATTVAVFAEHLRSVPDKLEREAGLNPRQAEMVERLIDAELEALRERLLAVTRKTPPKALAEGLRSLLAAIEPEGSA